MIRLFQTADAPSCASLIHACLERDASISRTLRESLRASETPGAMEERARLFYVAVYESGQRILGIVGLDMNEIRLLCVSPDHWRQGIGRALFEHIRSMVPAFLFPDIFVYSSLQGRDFYRACNFVEKGQVDFEFGREKMRTAFMTLPIR